MAGTSGEEGPNIKLKRALEKKEQVQKQPFRWYPFQWIYRFNVRGFHPFPFLFILALLVFTIPPTLTALGMPLPQITDLPVVGDIISRLLGASNDRDLFVNMTWVLWWPLFIFTILIFRRLWCAICPFGLLTDIGNRGGKWLRGGKDARPINISKYLFMGAFTFLIIGYLHDAINITNSVILSVEFVLFFFLFAFVLGVILPRRSFCLSFCFVGDLPNLFGRMAFLGLKTDRQKCDTCEGKWCQTGTEHLPQGVSELREPLINVNGCPMYINVPQLGHTESNNNCIFCGNCIKNCPYDAIHYKFLTPGYEIKKNIQLHSHETLFAVGVIGLLAMFVAMEGGLLGQFGSWIVNLLRLPTVNYHWLFAGLFTIIAIAGMAVLYLIATMVSTAVLEAPKKDMLHKLGAAYLPFAYLVFIRDIFVVYFMGGSILSGMIARGPDWAKALVPLIDNGIVVIGALWSAVIIFAVLRNLSGKQEMPSLFAAALPHLMILAGLTWYWLNYSFGDYVPLYNALSIPLWIPLVFPALLFGVIWIGWRAAVPAGVGE